MARMLPDGVSVNKVFKYDISPTASGDVTIDMPIDSEALHVNMQNGRICLWCRVNDGAPMVARRFRVVGTGHDGADGDYVGTVLLSGGALVFHIFAL